MEAPPLARRRRGENDRTSAKGNAKFRHIAGHLPLLDLAQRAFKAP
jgi:hypothetical protein